MWSTLLCIDIELIIIETISEARNLLIIYRYGSRAQVLSEPTSVGSVSKASNLILYMYGKRTQVLSTQLNIKHY